MPHQSGNKGSGGISLSLRTGAGKYRRWETTFPHPHAFTPSTHSTGFTNLKEEGASVFSSIKWGGEGFPGGLVVKNLSANAGSTGVVPDLERSHMLQSN